MKRALVVGSAKGVWDEVAAAQAMCAFDSYYVVKMTGIKWNQGYFHWVTLHPEFMPNYRKARELEGLLPEYEVIAPLLEEIGRHHEHQCDRRVSYRFPGMTSSGSSGLFAVKIALDDGHDRVVCAGVPMEQAAGHFIRGGDWPQCDGFRLGWQSALPHIKHKVRSLSGWTKELLGGAPTPEWLGLREAAEPGREVQPSVQ
jgi:hypothetical protein